MSQKELEKLVDAFEIEELEDRLEFIDWKAEGGCSNNVNTGETTCSAGVTVGPGSD